MNDFVLNGDCEVVEWWFILHIFVDLELCNKTTAGTTTNHGITGFKNQKCQINDGKLVHDEHNIYMVEVTHRKLHFTAIIKAIYHNFIMC